MKKFIAILLLIVSIASVCFLGLKTSWFKDWSYFKIETSQEESFSSSDSDSISSNKVSTSISSSLLSSNSSSVSTSNSSSSSVIAEKLNSNAIKDLNGVKYYEIEPNSHYTYNFTFNTDKEIGTEFSANLISYGSFYWAKVRSVNTGYYFREVLTTPQLIPLGDFDHNIIKNLSITDNVLSFDTGEFEIEDYCSSREMGRNASEWYHQNMFLKYIDSTSVVNDYTKLTYGDIFIDHVASFGDTSTNVSELTSCLNHNMNFLESYYISIEITDSLSGETCLCNVRLTQNLEVINDLVY